MPIVKIEILETRKITVEINLEAYPEDSRTEEKILEIEEKNFQENYDYVDMNFDFAVENGMPVERITNVTVLGIFEDESNG